MNIHNETTLIHQYFNCLLKLVQPMTNDGYHSYRGSEEAGQPYLGIFSVIDGKEFLIKTIESSIEDRMNFKLPPREFSDFSIPTKKDYDVVKMFQEERYRQSLINREIEKVLIEKYVPIAKKYMEIKADEHLRAEFRIAKELGFDYKPFLS